MADQPIKHEQIIEDKVFQNTSDSADILLTKLTAMIASFKQLMVLTGKKIPLADPKTLDEAAQLQAALKKITDLENGLTQVQKAKIQAQVIVSKQTKEYKDSLKEQTVATENSTQALRRMQRELANLPAGSKEFNELAKKAGALKDKITDAKDAVKAFASESKLTNAKTLFGQIGDDLKNMNFADAADKSRQLASVVKSMTFSEAAKGIKDFGSTLLNLGKAILLNPFTLILGAVVGLGIALWNLKDRVKIIGDVFAFFGNIISGIKDLFFQFTDAIGLTADALNNKLNKALEETKSKMERLSKAYEFQIKLATALGKDTLNIEIRAQEERKKLIEKQVSGLLQLQKVNGKLTDEQKKSLEDLTAEYVKADQEIILLRAKSIKDFNDKQAEINKKTLEELRDFQKERNDINVEANEDEQKRKDEQLLINQKYNIEIAKLREDAAQEILKKEAEYNQAIQDENEKNRLEVLDAIDAQLKRIEDKEKAHRLKMIEDTFKTVDAITSGIAEGLQKRSELQQSADQRDIDMHARMLDVQAKLAAEGKENVLAETLAQTAKAEEKKLQDAKKAAKQQELLAEIQVFTDVLSAALKSDKPFFQALGEAGMASGLTKVAFSKLFAGFYEGTEDTGTTDSPLDAKGGRVAVLHDNERVVPKRLNDMLGGISNDELVNRAIAMPTLPESVISVEAFNNRQVAEMTKEIKALRSDMASKPVQHFELGNKMGEYREKIYQDQKTTIINHKNSLKRPSLRLNG